jgi:TonB family protein
MFDRLIESRHRPADRSQVSSGTVAVLVHAGVCAAAVLGTLRPHRVSGAEPPPILISWSQPVEEESDADPHGLIPGPMALLIDVPPQVPIGLPLIDAGARFDPTLPSRGARDGAGERGVDGAPDGPWSPTAVDEPPVLLAGPSLAYPEVLRRAGTTGTVVVQVVIDTLGRAEPRSLVLESSHAGFEAAARAYVLGAVFRPGRTHGRAVRVLVRLPIGFTLRSTR